MKVCHGILTQYTLKLWFFGFFTHAFDLMVASSRQRWGTSARSFS